MNIPPFVTQFLFLLAAAMGVYVIVLLRRGSERFRSGGALPAFGVLAGGGVLFFLLLFGMTQETVSLFAYLAWAGLLAGWGFAQGKADAPETLSPVFWYSCFGAAACFVLLALGVVLPAAAGAGVLFLGTLFGVITAWMFAASGIRGSRFAFAAIPAAVSGLALLLLQPEFASLVLAVSWLLAAPAAGLAPARRKEKREEEHVQVPTHGPDWKPTIILDDYEDEEEEEEEVVVVRRTSDTPPPAKKAAATKESAGESPPPKAPAARKEPARPKPSEKNPDAGLATEPGRRSDVKIDPWTGAAIKDDDKK